MQTEIILAKYGELALKGLNRNTFEDILMKNIKRRLKPLGKFTYTRAQSTIYIEPETPDIDLDVVMDNMKKIFGIAALCKACVDNGCDLTKSFRNLLSCSAAVVLNLFCHILRGKEALIVCVYS